MTAIVTRVWCHGTDFSSQEFSGSSIYNALEAAQGDMPERLFASAYLTLLNAEEYRDWSWYTFNARWED